MSTCYPKILHAPEIIETTKDLYELVEDLRYSPLVAVDTESNSLFAYHEQVCLIQLSVRAQEPGCSDIYDFVIDPLVIDDMSPLGELFSAHNIEIVFHAAEYDVMCLKRDFGFEFTQEWFGQMNDFRICLYQPIPESMVIMAYVLKVCCSCCLPDFDHSFFLYEFRLR